MKSAVRSINGEKKGEVVFPEQFQEEIRPDLVKRAVLALQSHERQPYGTDPEAGKKYSAKLSRRRRDYKGAYGHGISRVPRKIMSHTGTRFNWQGAFAPNTVGGRVAHPPKAEKIYAQKINTKERVKAIRSALAASIVKELVLKRGHIVEDYPIVVEDAFESLKKAKEVYEALLKFGLEKELERSSRKTQRSGKAQRRGRSFKKAKGPLVVVSKKCDLLNAAANIPGIDVVEVGSLNAKLLAPGCDMGRLTIYTKGSLEAMAERKLFSGKSIAVKAAPVQKTKAVPAKKAAAKPKVTKSKEAKE
jgi:large subunit ribosomal protein L4e